MCSPVSAATDELQIHDVGQKDEKKHQHEEKQPLLCGGGISDPELYECRICHAVFNSEEGVTLHFENTHSTRKLKRKLDSNLHKLSEKVAEKPRKQILHILAGRKFADKSNNCLIAEKRNVNLENGAKKKNTYNQPSITNLLRNKVLEEKGDQILARRSVTFSTQKLLDKNKNNNGNCDKKNETNPNIDTMSRRKKKCSLCQSVTLDMGKHLAIAHRMSSEHCTPEAVSSLIAFTRGNKDTGTTEENLNDSGIHSVGQNDEGKHRNKKVKPQCGDSKSDTVLPECRICHAMFNSEEEVTPHCENAHSKRKLKRKMSTNLIELTGKESDEPRKKILRRLLAGRMVAERKKHKLANCRSVEKRNVNLENGAKKQKTKNQTEIPPPRLSVKMADAKKYRMKCSLCQSGTSDMAKHLQFAHEVSSEHCTRDAQLDFIAAQ
jgi:hypothetical protein